MGVMISFFLLGWRDDYLKVIKKNSDGVSAKQKLLWQAFTAIAASYVLIKFNIISTQLYVPFFKNPIIDLGWYYIAFSSLVIVGSSNAVNLTDGLDGLVTGPVITSAATLGILAYLTGHYAIAQYLYIPFVPGTGELLVLLAATVGASVGFLWYNSYPAQSKVLAKDF
jgi:phospho-N-acetylmuramoyl-pentapeptide-transferase